MKLTETPALRRDLIIKQPTAEGRPFLVTDPLLERVFTFSADEMVLMRLLNGRMPLSHVFAYVKGTRVVDEQDMLAFVGKLRRDHLLITASSKRTIDALREWRALVDRATDGMFRQLAVSEHLAKGLVIDASLRHDCMGSSHCCRQYSVVVPEHRRDEILACSWEGQLDGEFTQLLRPAPQRLRSGNRYVIASGDGGRCAFLSGALCQIHARRGVEAKPLACRLFPVDFVITPQGVQATLMQECVSYDQTFATGTPLGSRSEELSALLESEPGLALRAVPENVAILDGLSVSYEAYRMLEWRLLVGWQRAADPEAGLRQIGQCLYSVEQWLERGESADWPTLIQQLPHHELVSDQREGAQALKRGMRVVIDTLTLVETLLDAKITVIKNTDYLNVPHTKRVIAEGRKRLRDGAPAAIGLTPRQAAYGKQVIFNYLSGKAAFYFPTFAHGVAMLQLMLSMTQLSLPLWPERGDADGDPERHFHQSLVYWSTLWRFPEFRSALYGMDSHSVRGLLYHLPSRFTAS